MSSDAMIPQTLYRYPIKGLGPERSANITVFPSKVSPGTDKTPFFDLPDYLIPPLRFFPLGRIS